MRLFQHNTRAVIGDCVYADVGIRARLPFLIQNLIGKFRRLCFSLLCPAKLQPARVMDGMYIARTDPGDCSILLNLPVMTGQAYLADDIVRDFRTVLELIEIPVQGLRISAEGKLADRIRHQCKISIADSLAIIGILPDKYRKVSRVTLRHIILIGPDLVHTQAPALEISNGHIRIRSCDSDPVDTGNSISVGLKGVLSVKLIITLEGVAVRNFRRSFLHTVLCPGEHIADLDRMIRGNPGNLTI